jgi:hypothetical protein
VEIFPFSSIDWQKVKDVVLSHVNATLANDDVLSESTYVEILAVLDELRKNYGEHPILIETAADFCNDPNSRLKMYRCAIQIAENNNLPTLSIRLSYAKVLLQDFKYQSEALSELNACKPELINNKDEYVLQEWNELLRQASELTTSSPN